MESSEELFVTLPSGVRLCYQTFGNSSDSAVLFVPGHGGSMLEWRDELLSLFSPGDDKHYIIRFDQRDTGLSTEFPIPSDYTLWDMVGDVEGLVDHLDLPSKGFHLVGASLGGAISYMFASRRPQQLRSLTLIYTSPGASAGLPLNTSFMDIQLGMGQDRQTFIDNMMKLYKAYSTQPPSEEHDKENKAYVTRITDRDIRGGTVCSKGPNHGTAAYSERPGVEALKHVKCPAAVIQAAKDQVFPEAHGEALAKGLQNAEYVLWDDVGHELPRRIWDRLAGVLLRTWKRGDEEWAGFAA